MFKSCGSKIMRAKQFAKKENKKTAWALESLLWPENVSVKLILHQAEFFGGSGVFCPNACAEKF